MTWEELRELDPALITIGSHTMTHPILSTVDDACLQHELAQSRARLESELGRAVEFFCFPNGANDARVRAAAARVYRAAVTTRPGSLEGRVDLHGLPRLSMPESDATLAWRMWR
jgi:peptidoglycan/xylan/chitin deacetylase (PgdA/CDA1 family)